MVTDQQNSAAPRCVLCPAGCELQLVATGPDRWRSEFPLDDKRGVCPRGSALGELLTHPQRILSAASRDGQRLMPMATTDALTDVLAAADESDISVLLDGHVPIEQMLDVAAWCSAWPKARFCLVVEPAERRLLLGAESSGADYMTDDQLADCDGFVIIGDAFAADPMCARGVFDALQAQPRLPIVALDAAAGTPAKFATHRVDTSVGRQLAALVATALAAGVEMGAELRDVVEDNPSADAAGQAIAKCTRLGVIVAAEYGRSEAWQQIGHLAGLLAAAKGGGLAAQTVGLNALAAVRLGASLGGVGLGEALSTRSTVCLAVGCDVLGMLGWSDGVLAAAAALPNRATDAARYVLPVTMPGEWSGTYLVGGARLLRVEPLLPPPAGVVSPAELVAALARQAGVSAPPRADVSTALKRLRSPVAPLATSTHAPSSALLLARRAAHHGCGLWTTYGSWQAAAEELPDLRIGPAYANRLGLANLAVANVRLGGQLIQVRARYAPELDGECVVLSESLPGARLLAPSSIEDQTGNVAAEPVAVDITT